MRHACDSGLTLPLQPLSLSASSSQTDRPNTHDAGKPPAIPFAVPGPRTRIFQPRLWKWDLSRMPPHAAVGSATWPRSASLFGFSLTEMSFLCHPIFCSFEELLHPTHLVGLRLLWPLRSVLESPPVILFCSILSVAARFELTQHV